MKSILKKIAMLSLATFIHSAPQAQAQSDNYPVDGSLAFANLTTVSLGTTPLFQIICGMDQLSAADRAQLMQSNLNSALTSANNPLALAAKVVTISHNGQTHLRLGGNEIGIVDTNTAAAMGMSTQQLARLWSGNLRTTLRNNHAVSQHIASLQSGDIARTMEASATAANTLPTSEAPSMDFVSLAPGLQLPLVISTLPNTGNIAPGQLIDGETAVDIALPGGHTIAAGTKLSGQISQVRTAEGQSPLVSISLDMMQISDGTRFPIDARAITATIDELKKGKQLTLRLKSRAQVAVAGSVL